MMRNAPYILVAAITLAGSLSAAAADLPNIYRNGEYGFSIRYASDMKPIIRDPAKYGTMEMGWMFILDFITSGDNPVTALRIIVKEPKPPTYPATDLATLKAGCKSYTIATVGNRTALICISCGSAACNWTIHVPGPPQFTILTLDKEALEKSAPEDGALPIRSMIESIQFVGAEQR